MTDALLVSRGAYPLWSDRLTPLVVDPLPSIQCDTPESASPESSGECPPFTSCTVTHSQLLAFCVVFQVYSDVPARLPNQSDRCCV